MFSEIYCVIHGKVHGVGLRAYIETVAREHGVTGWVRNNPSQGTVEVLMQGIPDVLKECIEELHNGSVLSKIEGVGVDWRTPREQFDDFKVIT
jgi:acylphosphatase